MNGSESEKRKESHSPLTTCSAMFLLNADTLLLSLSSQRLLCVVSMIDFRIPTVRRS